MYGPAFLRGVLFSKVAKSHASQPRHRNRRHLLPSTDSCAYTIERNGKRWTVQVPLAQLDACGANKQARRDYLGNVLLAAMDGPPDGAMSGAGA